MSNPSDTSISLAYARFAGRVEAILAAADRSDAWKVQQTRDAMARMDAEVAAVKRQTTDPMAAPLDRHGVTPTPTWGDNAACGTPTESEPCTEHGEEGGAA